MSANLSDNADAFDGVPLGELIRRRTERLLSVLSREPVEGIYPVMMREVERALQTAVLMHTDGRREEAARILGLHRNTLRLRLNAMGVGKTGPRSRRKKSTRE